MVEYTTAKKRELNIQREISPGEAEELFKRVLGEFGVLLDFEIVARREPASFVWGKVTLPRWYLSRPRGVVLQTLRHEVGHRVVFPGKPDWEKLAAAIARKRGVTDVQNFVNAIADLLVDWELLKKYGREYYERVVDAGSYRGKDPRMWFMFCAYQAMAEELGIETPDFRERASKLLDERNRDVLEKAERAFEIVKSSLSLESKIESLADLLKDLFHAVMAKCFDAKIVGRGGIPNLSRLSPAIPLGREENPVRDPSWLSAQLALYAPPSEIDLLSATAPGVEGRPAFAPDETLVEAVRLSLYAKYVEAREALGRAGGEVEELEQWTIGDLPYELRVEETLRLFGEVLPPIFSLKYGRREEEEAGSRGGSVAIVVDCSGSMGRSMRVVKQAAFSILMEAERRGDEVLLVFFCGEPASFGPGRDYGEYGRRIAAVVARGGTNLAPALSIVAKYARRAGSLSTFVITDAEVADVGRSLALLRELSEKGKVVFFWISDYPVPDTWLARAGAKVYVVDPRRDFTEEALREAVF